jgi:tetratricopeptide (TPR) repeat protein
LSKSRRRKRRKSLFNKISRGSRRPAVNLERAFEQADDLIQEGRAWEAVELLEPLLASHPRVAELHYYLGYARSVAGDIWNSLTGFEQAIKLSDEPSYWFPLATLYANLGLNAHALNAFRQTLKYHPDHPMSGEVRETIASLEQDLQAMASSLNLPVAQVEKGLNELDRGQRTLRTGDYRTCITANRRAIELIPDWPPPQNNLSLALFFDGQPEQAIATARQVLTIDPQNIQALSNAIRFLAWTDQVTEARALWEQLHKITPQDATERVKMSEAAAVLEEDESVYQLLKPLDKSAEETPEFFRHVQLFLAVAEANTGRRGAQRRLNTLRDHIPWVDNLLVALKAKRPGPGWAERYPYYHGADLIPGGRMEEFVNLASRKDKMSSRRFRREIRRFVARFPQIVRVAEKLIWEEQQTNVGIIMLSTIATPEAYAALRRFGVSQAGDDEDRTQALFRLAEAGVIPPDETVRVWLQGEWREIQLRQYEISDESEPEYSPEVAELLNSGLQAFQQDDHQRAERLFQQALALDAQAKEAYNNLGTIYSRREERKRAKEMFQAALEIDPIYVFPRGNLATYLLDEGDVEGAKDMMAPLAGMTHFRPQEMAFYSYIQARILMYEEEYEAARKALEASLAIIPDYGPAKSLLEHLELVTRFQSGFGAFMERQQQNYRTRRARLQAKLTTPAPSLSEVLPLYSKDVLTGMAHVVIRWGGWSGLRKAELLQQIVGALSDPDLLKSVVADLQDEERAALDQVMAKGGNMAWSDFDARYGNDLEESPYWNWHEPETTMGRLRQRGLLAEATVDGELLVVVPAELRPILSEL